MVLFKFWGFFMSRKHHWVLRISSLIIFLFLMKIGLNYWWGLDVFVIIGGLGVRIFLWSERGSLSLCGDLLTCLWGLLFCYFQITELDFSLTYLKGLLVTRIFVFGVTLAGDSFIILRGRNLLWISGLAILVWSGEFESFVLGLVDQLRLIQIVSYCLAPRCLAHYPHGIIFVRLLHLCLQLVFSLLSLACWSKGT